MLVTALCLTRNRREWLPRAIECFLAQTHAEKEMLIVADGLMVNDLVPIGAPIAVVYAPEMMTIGAKRNLGCDMARGEIVAHWDDDDHSAPGRLADQVARLADTGKAVTAYHSMKFTDGRDWWLYEGIENFVGVGTSLCYRRDWQLAHPFPPRQLSEDGAFVQAAVSAREFVTATAGDLMHATIHAGNTSRRDLRNYKKLL